MNEMPPSSVSRRNVPPAPGSAFVRPRPPGAPLPPRPVEADTWKALPPESLADRIDRYNARVLRSEEEALADPDDPATPYGEEPPGQSFDAFSAMPGRGSDMGMVSSNDTKDQPARGDREKGPSSIS